MAVVTTNIVVITVTIVFPISEVMLLFIGHKIPQGITVMTSHKVNRLLWIGSINGINIRDYGLEYLRKNIAVVFQESYLFNDMIANNIRMANQQASDEDVIMAAKAANIHEFISSLPDGYQTIVGERGQTLSGGERQRISIARALLKDAPLLLLDEATSSVDAESEALIQASLNELMKNHTTIIVAHRLSTVQDADLICVLENGMIAETGTHEQLLEKKGVYYKLVQAQEGIRS